MSLKEIFSESSLWIENLFLFLSYIYLHVLIRIRIQNTDQDPQSSWIRIQYGSGTTTQCKPVCIVDLVPILYFP